MPSLWKLCSLARDVSEHSNSHQLYHAFLESPYPARCPCVNMSTTSSLRAHKVFMRCVTQSPRHDCQFSPHRLQVSRRCKACLHGYTTADDRKRLQAVIRRGIRSGLCEQCHKTVDEIVEDADEKLFSNITVSYTHLTLPTIYSV